MPPRWCRCRCTRHRHHTGGIDPGGKNDCSVVGQLERGGGVVHLADAGGKRVGIVFQHFTAFEFLTVDRCVHHQWQVFVLHRVAHHELGNDDQTATLGKIVFRYMEHHVHIGVPPVFGNQYASRRRNPYAASRLTLGGATGKQPGRGSEQCNILYLRFHVSSTFRKCKSMRWQPLWGRSSSSSCPRGISRKWSGDSPCTTGGRNRCRWRPPGSSEGKESSRIRR